VLRIYHDPDRLRERLPVIRLLTRPLADIRAAAERVRPAVAASMDRSMIVSVVACESQIGSGALPTRTIRSAGLALRPAAKAGAGSALQRVAAAFRALPVPVIGRIQDDSFCLDMRCLDDEAAFLAQLTHLEH
jgi:L-seryl-tRNA(Ser) seleniumtransferase